MISSIFIYVGYAVLLVNCILLLKGFSYNERPFKIFALYSLSMLVIQLMSQVFIWMKMHNLFLSHFYFIIQFILLSAFFYNLINDKFQRKVILYFLITCLVLLTIQYVLNFELFFIFNHFEIFITSLALIVFATFHLYNMLNESKKYYYITVGLTIYLFGSTVVFLTANLLNSFKSKIVFNSIFDLNSFLYVVYQLFIMYELVTLYHRKRMSYE